MAPVAAVSVEFHWRAGGGELVPGCGQGGAFGGVFAFAADRTFAGVVHGESFRELPSSAIGSLHAKIIWSNFCMDTNFPDRAKRAL
jgi:hypothetical protein